MILKNDVALYKFMYPIIKVHIKNIWTKITFSDSANIIRKIIVLDLRLNDVFLTVNQ